MPLFRRATPPVVTRHCKACETDWNARLGRDCWLCGAEGAPGHLPTIPTASNPPPPEQPLDTADELV